MKKALVLVLTLILCLGACAAAAEGEKIELTLQRIGTDPAEHAFWEWCISEFEAEHDDIHIILDEVGIGSEMDTKLNTLFGSGSGPDLIGHGILSVAGRVEQGHYQAIDSYFDAWEGKDDILPAVLANGTYKGHVYGLGYSTTPYVFAYRKDLLDEAGLSVPTTWDELAEAARALTVKDGDEITFSGFCFPSAGGNLVELDVFVFGNGGRWMDEDSNPVMTGDEKVEAIEFLTGLLPDVNIPYSSSDTNPFVKGQAAMTLINNAALTTMLQDEAYAGKVGIALPPNNGTPATFCGCNMLFIGRDCKHPDEAFSFIEFALSREATLKRAEMVRIPVTRASLLEEYLAMDPWNGARYECVEHGIGMPRAVWSTVFQTVRNELVQSVLFGTADAAAALQNAQETIEFEMN